MCENQKACLSLTWRTGCPGERHIWICLHCSSSTPPPQRVKPPRATKGIPDHYDYSSYDQWTWPKMKNLDLCPHYRVQAWPLPLPGCHLESCEARSARKDHNFQTNAPRRRSDFLSNMCTMVSRRATAVRACQWADDLLPAACRHCSDRAAASLKETWAALSFYPHWSTLIWPVTSINQLLLPL